MSLDSNTPGDRIRSIRMRGGLTQRELAARARVSLSLLKKLEAGTVATARLETLRKFARALGVATSVIASGPDADPADDSDVSAWEPVRDAIAGRHHGEPDGEPTLAGVRGALAALVPLLLASRYGEVRAVLPALLRDADAVAALAGSSGRPGALAARSTARQAAGFMMGQTWQLEAALQAMDLALADAPGGLASCAAADWKCWALLRRGDLAACGDMAQRWADDCEPRISRAKPEELAAWGRFLILSSTSAARDNRPDDARGSLRLARSAATVLGRDMVMESNPWQVFGPRTVAMVAAENAMVADMPDATLRIGRQVSGAGFPVARNWLRHRLDVAAAYVRVPGGSAEAVDVLWGVRDAAPEWLEQQRSARATVAAVIEARKRKIPSEMRRLADAVRLPLRA